MLLRVLLRSLPLRGEPWAACLLPPCLPLVLLLAVRLPGSALRLPCAQLCCPLVLPLVAQVSVPLGLCQLPRLLLLHCQWLLVPPELPVWTPLLLVLLLPSRVAAHPAVAVVPLC